MDWHDAYIHQSLSSQCPVVPLAPFLFKTSMTTFERISTLIDSITTPLSTPSIVPQPPLSE